MKITRYEIEQVAGVLREHYGNSLPPVNEDLVAEQALLASKAEPPCDCGRADGTNVYTAYDGNWGGHAIGCPRRDWDNERSAGFLSSEQLIDRASELIAEVKSGKVDAIKVAGEVGKLIKIYGERMPRR